VGQIEQSRIRSHRNVNIFDWRVKQSDISPSVARGESTSLCQLLRALIDAYYAALRADSIFERWETQTCAASRIDDRLARLQGKPADTSLAQLHGPNAPFLLARISSRSGCSIKNGSCVAFTIFLERPITIRH
jgi:hypothetical protein